MQPASDRTVLGDFHDATFTYNGIQSTFFLRDGRPMVRTDGPDGMLQEFAVGYTFGVYPLQQYLVGFPDGRFQALGIAWDSRPAEHGGQRWFHLYPDQNISHSDPLHWTGEQQNWNHMCAECHSTNVRKNFDLARNRFDTTWSEVNVACEACHGPGADHVAWASGDRQAGAGHRGLAVRLDERAGITWTRASGSDTARRSTPRTSSRELELCARCHSRRGQFHADYTHGKPLSDTHRLALLTPDLYHSDGQIRDEVFEYGSFLQSRMQAQGVTCSDCHEPHGGGLRGEGAAVCLQCHAAARFASEKHHFHPPGSAGSDCLACHAPTTTYMLLDARHDHSFRIPRPDLTASLGVPNACNGCHREESAQWAAERLRDWYGEPASGHQQFAGALHAGHSNAPAAGELLMALAGDSAQPAIARATAVVLLADRLDPLAFEAIRPLLADPDPLLRSAAAQALVALPPALQLGHLWPLLDDPVRLVRLDAARALAGVPGEMLDARQRLALERGIGEYIAAEMTNADRPESWLNIGLIRAAQGRIVEAEDAYRAALRMQPAFHPAAVNLADLHGSTGRESQGEAVLRNTLDLDPLNADLHQALGLSLVRQRRMPEALAALQQADRLGGDDPRHGYLYALALNGAGRADEAIRTLEAVVERHPRDADSLFALATLNRDAGDIEAARRFARRLAEIAPQDRQTGLLLRQLGIPLP